MVVRKRENGTIEGHYVRVKCDIGLNKPFPPEPLETTVRLNPPSGEQPTNTIVDNINTIEEKIKEKKNFPSINKNQLDIESLEIYELYVKDTPKEKRIYLDKSQTLPFISSLLKEYDYDFFKHCIATYKKNIEPKFWMKPSNFFSNNKKKEKYRPFLDYAPTEEEKTREPKVLDLSFFR